MSKRHQRAAKFPHSCCTLGGAEAREDWCHRAPRLQQLRLHFHHRGMSPPHWRQLKVGRDTKRHLHCKLRVDGLHLSRSGSLCECAPVLAPRTPLECPSRVQQGQQRSRWPARPQALRSSRSHECLMCAWVQRFVCFVASAATPCQA